MRLNERVILKPGPASSGRDGAGLHCNQTRRVHGSASRAETLLDLQRTYGNAFVRRLVHRKLSVSSQSGDIYGRPLSIRRMPLQLYLAPTQSATATRPTLSMGSTGPDVQALQELLNRSDTPPKEPLAPDGQFGAKTQGALVAYQLAHGLVADGIAGPLTWGALESAALATGPDAAAAVETTTAPNVLAVDQLLGGPAWDGGSGVPHGDRPWSGGGAPGATAGTGSQWTSGGTANGPGPPSDDIAEAQALVAQFVNDYVASHPDVLGASSFDWNPAQETCEEAVVRRKAQCDNEKDFYSLVTIILGAACTYFVAHPIGKLACAVGGAFIGYLLRNLKTKKCAEEQIANQRVCNEPTAT